MFCGVLFLWCLLSGGEGDVGRKDAGFACVVCGGVNVPYCKYALCCSFVCRGRASFLKLRAFDLFIARLAMLGVAGVVGRVTLDGEASASSSSCCCVRENDSTQRPMLL